MQNSLQMHAASVWHAIAIEVAISVATAA